MTSASPAPTGISQIFLVSALIMALLSPASAQTSFPTFEELAATRSKAHQDRFRDYIMKKLEVYSIVQQQRGMCLDFIGESDGLYQSKFDAGPIMVDLANCGKEDSFVDGRVRGIRILGPREHREGLTSEQVDDAVYEINRLYNGTVFEPIVIRPKR